MAPPSQGEADREPIHQRNLRHLRALALSPEGPDRRRIREVLVRENLPLVYAVVGRMGAAGCLPVDELRQIGSIGLLRAIEAFQPCRGCNLSSFAVPYIRGAIQHELRDRFSMIRIPRDLWELRRRALQLQERRRRQGIPPLTARQLADSLACSPSQLREALELAALLAMRSLDAPPAADGETGRGDRPLQELLADPLGLEAAGSDPRRSGGWERAESDGDDGDLPPSPEMDWLRGHLDRLQPRERRLLLGHHEGCSWVELGRELGIHPRQAQRLTSALLDRLLSQSLQWQRDREASTAGDRQPAIPSPQAGSLPHPGLRIPGRPGC